MLSINTEEKDDLKQLGERLCLYRKTRTHDTQTQFAARIGISVPTYRKMEKGDPTVPIGYWIRALNLLSRLEDVGHWLPVSLFDQVGKA